MRKNTETKRHPERPKKCNTKSHTPNLIEKKEREKKLRD